MTSIQIEDKKVGIDYPTYFIADIGANHDGDINRAKALIHLAAEAGADAIKFQHFKAADIVSDAGFKKLNGQQSHQAQWGKSVYDVYQDASLPRQWNAILKAECKAAGVHFFSSPYDFTAVDELNELGVPAHKIGSGDITWTQIIEYIASSNLPVFLATGASSLEDVVRAMAILQQAKVPVCLMQCNTNYTGSEENFNHVHLRVLKLYEQLWPEAVLGFSDHTPRYSAVLGAVALGARAVEKHFTDSNDRTGPDHKFALNPTVWREMVDATRELEASLGSVEKFVAENEKETVVLQRRAFYVKDDLAEGEILSEKHLKALRPAPANSIFPYQLKDVLGKRVKKSIKKDECLMEYHIE